MIDMARIPMDWKELQEARRVGVPESIVGKMAIGIEPSEKEKEIINKLGKVYVEAHKKDGKWVKPQLRDLPGGSRSKLISPREIDWLKKYYVVEGKSFYAGATYEPLAYFTTIEEAIREKNKLMNLYPTDLREGLRTRYRYRKLTGQDAQILEWMQQERE